jgi:BirA family biotin operon repressor/biotin-[acetyl-CoA-carboxylase] ligase
MFMRNNLTTRDRILDALRASGGNPVSGEALAQQCGVTRAAVWKAVNALRNAGYPIQAATNSGYSLASTYDTLSAQEIYQSLSAFLSPEQIHVFGEIDSTNAYAKRCATEAVMRDTKGELTEEGRKLHCSVYIADMQTAGRGRMGRSFYSPRGSGLYLSLLYCPENGVQNPARFTASAAVAVCVALEQLYSVDCRIKWVNDIYVGGKKVCGILSEGISNFENGQVEAVVVGIGVNVVDAGFPPELAGIAGAVLDDSGDVSIVAKFPDRNRLAAEIIARLLGLFSNHDKQAATMSEYRTRSLTIGTEVTVFPVAGDETGAFKARAVDITDDAELVVEAESGERRFLKAGEVQYSRI